MKKLLAIVALSLPLTALALDDNGMKVPEWKDFAPKAYVDVKEPSKLGKLNVVASYWYQRKVDFEAGLEECQGYEANNERFTCYENLKVKQFKENSEYNARVEARQQNSSIQEMNSMTDTMFPIGGYLNNIGKFQANEIR